MELSVVPVFQSEIVPRQVRGLVVATYQGSIYVSLFLSCEIVANRNEGWWRDNERDLRRYQQAGRRQAVANSSGNLCSCPGDRYCFDLVYPGG